MRKHIKPFLAVVGLALGASASQPWFGASFDGYADGEALSDRLIRRKEAGFAIIFR